MIDIDIILKQTNELLLATRKSIKNDICFLMKDCSYITVVVQELDTSLLALNLVHSRNKVGDYQQILIR